MYRRRCDFTGELVIDCRWVPKTPTSHHFVIDTPSQLYCRVCRLHTRTFCIGSDPAQGGRSVTSLLSYHPFPVHWHLHVPRHHLHQRRHTDSKSLAVHANPGQISRWIPQKSKNTVLITLKGIPATPSPKHLHPHIQELSPVTGTMLQPNPQNIPEPSSASCNNQMFWANKVQKPHLRYFKDFFYSARNDHAIPV